MLSEQLHLTQHGIRTHHQFDKMDNNDSSNHPVNLTFSHINGISANTINAEKISAKIDQMQHSSQDLHDDNTNQPILSPDTLARFCNMDIKLANE